MKNPRLSSLSNPQANWKNKITTFLWRAGKLVIFSCLPHSHGFNPHVSLHPSAEAFFAELGCLLPGHCDAEADWRAVCTRPPPFKRLIGMKGFFLTIFGALAGKPKILSDRLIPTNYLRGPARDACLSREKGLLPKSISVGSHRNFW